MDRRNDVQRLDRRLRAAEARSRRLEAQILQGSVGRPLTASRSVYLADSRAKQFALVIRDEALSLEKVRK